MFFGNQSTKELSSKVERNIGYFGLFLIYLHVHEIIHLDAIHVCSKPVDYAYNSVLSISPSSSLTIKIYSTISLHIEQYYSQVYFPTSWTWSCAVHEYHSPSSLEFILPLSRASAKEVAKTRNKTKRKDTAIVGGVTDDLVLLVGSVAIVCCDYLLVKAEKRRKRQPHVTALLIAKCLPLHFH